MLKLPMRHKQVVVIGNVGSGKSTLCEYLTEEFELHFVPADELHKTNPFFQLSVEDRIRWSLASGLWFLKERVRLSQEAETMLTKSHVLIDSGIWMSLAYVYSQTGLGFFTDQEFELYQNYFDILTKDLLHPDLVIFLDGPVDFLRERIEERGREFEVKHHSVEYLSGLAEGLEFVREQLRSQSIPMLKYQVDSTGFSMERVRYELQMRLEG